MTHLAYAMRAFGAASAPAPAIPARLPLPPAGRCLAVIGDSGSGKTRALRALAACHGGAFLPELGRDELASPVLSLFDPCDDSGKVLRLLASVGLADGRLWRLRAGQLSAGEQQRLRLALALSGQPRLLILDEFDAHLDADSALALACAVRGLASRRGLHVAVSTHRRELLPFLDPADIWEIEDGCARKLATETPRDLADEFTFARGAAGDWPRFARWHYLGTGRPGPVSDVWLARLRGRDIGIVSFGYPHLMLAARRRALPQRFHPGAVRSYGAAALNDEVRLLQRVVVDPRYRGLGVAERLIRHGLERLDARWVECVAQMGAFSGFLTAAGFRRVCTLEPPRAAARLLRFCERRDIDPDALVHPLRRAALVQALPPEDLAALRRHFRALVKSRVETGHGSRRGREAPPVLASVLARLSARPEYFVHERGR